MCLSDYWLVRLMVCPSVYLLRVYVCVGERERERERERGRREGGYGVTELN